MFGVVDASLFLVFCWNSILFLIFCWNSVLFLIFCWNSSLFLIVDEISYCIWSYIVEILMFLSYMCILLCLIGVEAL